MVKPVNGKTIIKLTPSYLRPALVRKVVSLDSFSIGKEQLQPCLINLFKKQGLNIKEIFVDNVAKIRLLGMSPSLEQRVKKGEKIDQIFPSLELSLFQDENTLFIMGDKKNIKLWENSRLKTEASKMSGPINERLWEFDIGKEVEVEMVEANGVIYACTKDGRLYAIDALTGQKKWDIKKKEDAYSEPSMVMMKGADDKLYNQILFAKGNDGTLYAIYADNGSKLWSIPKVKAFTINKEMVYIAQEVKNLKTEERVGKLRFYNVGSATWDWEKDIDEGAIASLALADDKVYAGTENGKLYAFDAETGKARWNTDVGEKPIANLTATSALVLAETEFGELYAVDAKTGREKWFETPPGGSVSSITDGLVIWKSAVDGFVFASDAESGDLKWSRDVAKNSDGINLTVADGKVYVAADGSTLRALDIKNGRILWESESPNFYSYLDPVVAQGKVYVGTTDGNVFAFDIKNGKMIWEFETYGEFDSGPIVSQGIIYIGSSADGRLYALNAETGEDSLGNIVSQRAFEFFRDEKDKDLFNELQDQLSYDYPIKRRRAVEILGNAFIEEEGVRKSLEKMREDPDEAVRKAVEKVLEG